MFICPCSTRFTESRVHSRQVGSKQDFPQFFVGISEKAICDIEALSYFSYVVIADRRPRISGKRGHKHIGVAVVASDFAAQVGQFRNKQFKQLGCGHDCSRTSGTESAQLSQ